MTLPTNLTTFTPVEHAAYHNEIHQQLAWLALRTGIITAPTGDHLDDHNWLHSFVGNISEVTRGNAGHIAGHNTVHAFVNGLSFGPKQGVTQPGGSVSVAPGSSIASAITTAGNGGTVWLQAGLHRVTATVQPRLNQTILGEYGAIVDGSVVISGPWTQDGAAWWATGQLPATANATGVCQGGGTACQPCEDIFRDGAHLTRVMSQVAVTAGTYWNDYTNNRIYVGDDPNGHLIEQAKAAAFVHSNQATNAGVTIKNLQIRKFANPYQNGAVTAGNSTGTGWTIESCEIYLNHADGIRSFANTAMMRYNNVRDNGNLGIGAFNNDNMVISHNLLERNNNNGFDVNWEAGNIKVATVDDAIIRGNQMNDATGTGVWFDLDSRGGRVEGNTVSGNDTGIFYEISLDGTIKRNRVLNTSTEGIVVNTSPRTIVANNILSGNGEALSFHADPNRNSTDPPLYETRELLGLICSDNFVTQQAGYASAIRLFNGASTSYLNGVAFNRNRYTLDNLASNRFWLNQNRTWAQWQVGGKDTDGSAST